jgi:superfamily II DNA/RNA helicase
MTTEFLLSGLNAELEQTVSDLGYLDPPPIQTEVIPLMLEGHAVIGQAQTGTGKTAAFMLRLSNARYEARRDTGLVLAPTRELALQVAKHRPNTVKHLPVRVLAVYGGSRTTSR